MRSLVLRGPLVQSLMADPVWAARLEAVRSMDEVEEVFREFLELKGFRVAEVAA